MKIILLLLLACSAVNFGESNILDSLACSGKVLAEASDCVDAMDKDVKMSEKDQLRRTDEQKWCCAVRAFRNCVKDKADEHCGKDAAKDVSSLASRLQNGITSEECKDYGFIACITTLQWIVGAAVALGVLFLLSCICCCCCGGKRRGRPV